MQSTSIRTTLLAIRDEFRQLFLKYPPLHHERFTSPLEVTSEGWRAFAEANFTGAEKGHWYVAQGNLWLGRFTGVEEGLPDFLRLCHQLGKVVFDERKGSLAARSEWLDVVHDLAELRATPLLTGKVLPWKFGITQEADGWDEDDADLFCDAEIAQFDRDVEGGGLWHRLTEKLIKVSALFGLGQTNVLDDSPVSYEQWDHRSGEENRFPSEPFVGSLDNDVFRASAAAIDILLQPQEMFLWRKFTPEVMPFALSEITEPAAVSSPETNTSQDAPPDFLFAKTGNLWRIRFREGKTLEHEEFSESKGLEYYWRLLQDQGRTVPAINLSPHGTEAEGGKAGGSLIRQEEAFDDEARMKDFSGLREEGTSRVGRFSDEDLLDIQQQIKAHQQWLKTDADPQKVKEAKSELRRMERELRTKIEALPQSVPSTQAFNRVKSALRRARETLKNGKMPRLADHLEAHVKTSGKGWIYDPSPSIEWRLFKNE